MNKQMALKLAEKAQEVASTFSNPDREKNYDKENFFLKKIIPISELTAAVLFVKTSGKLALAFFVWINSGDGRWIYFFPKDTHIIGLKKLERILDMVEAHNFPFNFDDEKIKEKASIEEMKLE